MLLSTVSGSSPRREADGYSALRISGGQSIDDSGERATSNLFRTLYSTAAVFDQIRSTVNNGNVKGKPKYVQHAFLRVSVRSHYTTLCNIVHKKELVTHYKIKIYKALEEEKWPP